MEVNKIYNVDALTGLKMLPDNSVDCVVTSPPYWGLRDYGNAAITIWGGDPNCEHEFGTDIEIGLRTKPGQNAQCGNTLKEVAERTLNQGTFCVKCGAWRGQLGHEPTPELYVQHLVEIFSEVKRVLKPTGTLWLNLGDTYCGIGHKGNYKDPKCKDGRNGQVVAVNHKIKGLKPKDLVGIPWLVAFALRDDGWFLRQDIIWHKPNPVPESTKDRCTRSHEYIFLLSKNRKYYFDYEAIKEPAVTKPAKRDKYKEGYQADYPKGVRFSKGERVYGADGKRHKRDVWSVSLQPFKGAHFAVFPEDLIIPCILAGCPEGGIVLDPFMGSGTVAVVAKRLNRNFIGFEINPDYCEMAMQRISAKH